MQSLWWAAGIRLPPTAFPFLSPRPGTVAGCLPSGLNNWVLKSRLKRTPSLPPTPTLHKRSGYGEETSEFPASIPIPNSSLFWEPEAFTSMGSSKTSCQKCFIQPYWGLRGTGCTKQPSLISSCYQGLSLGAGPARCVPVWSCNGIPCLPLPHPT